MQVSIEGLDKGVVLAALYNASRPQGMGFLHYDPAPMTAEQGAKLLEQTTNFDYLMGRVMKIDLKGDASFEAQWYDRDNGAGAAASVIASLRQSGNATNDLTTMQHSIGVATAAEVAYEGMGIKPNGQTVGTAYVFSLGLGDVADSLEPAVKRALNATQQQEEAA